MARLKLKRIFYLVLFNILISATTTLAVIYFWERARPEDPQVTVVVLANPTSFSTSTQSQADASSPEAASPAMPTEGMIASSAEPVLMVEYQVKAGDTLGKIAVAFDVSLQDILTVNGMDDPDLITVGQTLLIPTGPLPTRTPAPTNTSAPTFTPRPGTPTPTSTPSPVIIGDPPEPVIASITGAGDLATERVKITRRGVGILSLAGWRLEDSNGNVYTFPDLALYEGGEIILHTRSGLDTVTDLYWNLAKAVWQAGEVALLRDDQGYERARFHIP